MVNNVSKYVFYALLMLAPTALAQQSPVTPKTIEPTHDQCTEDKAYKLYTISKLLIEARQSKAETENLLNADPTLKAKHKSYEKALADAMNTYHQLGGKAGKLEDVAPMDDPCASSASGPAKPTENQVQPAEAATAPAMDNHPMIKKAPIKHAKHVVKQHRSRKNDDARECAELESNRAVIACAEKYR